MGKVIRLAHNEISRNIVSDLFYAKKHLNTAKSFDPQYYAAGENKLRHARNDIAWIREHKPHTPSRIRSARAAILGFSTRHPHPVGCMCPFHGGHKKHHRAGIGRGSRHRRDRLF